MSRLLILLAALIAAPGVAATPQPVVTQVARAGDAFVAEFTFPRAAPAWGFFRSSLAEADKKSWRARSWTVLTPGVQLVRRGQFDALVASDGKAVPRTVRVRVTPFTEEVAADYVPALRLGGDSIALFDGHFAVFSVADAAILDRLKSDIDFSLIEDGNSRVAFQGGSDLRIAGDVDGLAKGASHGAYGLYGVPRAVETNGIATVVDSEMPRWFSDYIAGFTPQVIAALQSRLGPSGITRPTILAAWEGGERPGGSMNGGALKGLVLMRIEGQAALAENPKLRDMARWFIAHEAAHFWLGQAVRYETSADTWIMEGGADLLAARTVERIDPTFSSAAFIESAIRDCAELGRQPVATALDRGEHRAHYACGTVFALVAERAATGDVFEFLRGVIDSNRADGILTRADWLAALDRTSGKPELSNAIAALIDRGSSDPKAAIANLLRQAGIAFTLDAKGLPQLS